MFGVVFGTEPANWEKVLREDLRDRRMVECARRPRLVDIPATRKAYKSDRNYAASLMVASNAVAHRFRWSTTTAGRSGWRGNCPDSAPIRSGFDCEPVPLQRDKSATF
jgi:hypothetical protein